MHPPPDRGDPGLPDQHGSSPDTRTLAQLLGYSQTGICYVLRAAERDGQIQIDRSGYRLRYILPSAP